MPQAHRRRAHARDVILAESFAQPAFRQLLQKDFPFLNEQLRTKDEPGGFNCSPISVGTCAVPESNIDWESLPPGIDPSFGELKGYRAQRKRDQVQSLARIVCAIAEPGDRIVEFGAGSGHLGILLAHLLPQCHVVLIERNAFRLELARKRVEAAKLSNIELSATDATQFNRHAIASLYGELGLKLGRDQSGAQGSSNRARTALDSRRAAFQIGIGLHTCGLLTDAVQNVCLQLGAKYVLSPCCYGQTSGFFARSTVVAEALSPNQFDAVASAADFTANAEDTSFVQQPQFRKAKRCMQIVDYDRQQWAQGAYNYQISEFSLEPLNCSPKNNVIVGVPPAAAGNMDDLPLVRSNLTHRAQAVSDAMVPRPWSASEKIKRRILSSTPTQKHSSSCSGPATHGNHVHGQDMLQHKIALLYRHFSRFLSQYVRPRDVDVVTSPLEGHRLRVRFGIRRFPKLGLHYAEFANGALTKPVLTFPEASSVIRDAMASLIEVLRECDAFNAQRENDVVRELNLQHQLTERVWTLLGRQSGANREGLACVVASAATLRSKVVPGVSLSNVLLTQTRARPYRPTAFGREHWRLTNGLQAVHFLSTLAGDLLVSLIYDRKLDGCPAESGTQPPAESWYSSALSLSRRLNIDFVGRSRGQVITVCACAHHTANPTAQRRTNCVDEVLHVAGPSTMRTLLYRQVEGSFSNPNGAVNQQVLEWLCRVIRQFSAPGGNLPSASDLNLLEIYCGCGNHTVALAPMFSHVTAIELNRHLAGVCEFNVKQNGLADRVTVRQADSQRLCAQLLRSSQNQRHCPGKDHTRVQLWKRFYDCCLVDPPRAGLDASTLSLVQRFPRILYISCNPDSLDRDLQLLSASHHVVRYAVFDHFPGTRFVESGVVLEKIAHIPR
eukprot:INCI11684.1.p1 GENE.INCI11684.1~~INCI11684.1.p1  ORF type:complete len:896 (+),score=99.69 INCI11684.1:180-2867(+)